MTDLRAEKTDTFYAIGISYQQADLKTREAFSLSTAQLEQLLVAAQQLPLSGLLPMSTCNRTELYAWTSNIDLLIDLLLAHCQASTSLWEQVGWVKSGQEAMQHLFRVGAGLESNILGDFQIIGQVKRAFQQSKAAQTSHPYLERLVNTTIRISKRIKSETQLSRGSASIAFAASSYIHGWMREHRIGRVLLVGTGEIGKATCANLLKHIPFHQLTIINRSQAKAERIAAIQRVELRPWTELKEAIQEATVIVVATGASQPVIISDMVQSEQQQLFLDLSMPRNIDPDISKKKQYTVLDLDQLVQQTRTVLDQRSNEVPKAEEILETEARDFFYWLKARSFAPILKGIKEELLNLHQQEIDSLKRKHPDLDDAQLSTMSQLLIHKTTGHLAKFFHQQLADQAPITKV